MGLAIFENYSETKEGTNHAPFIVSMSQMQCFDYIKKWISQNNFSDIKPNKDYFEFFFKDQEFEITITINNEQENSLVNASVYGPTGKTRKKLREILDSLVKYFKSV